MAIRMTSEEYQKLYGVAPTLPSSSSLDVSPAPIRMTRAEYEARYYPQTPTQSGFKEGVEDIKQTGKAVADTFTTNADRFTGIDERIKSGDTSAFTGSFQKFGLGLSTVMESAFEVAVGALKLPVSQETEDKVKTGASNYVQALGERGKENFNQFTSELKDSEFESNRQRGENIDKFVQDFALYYASDPDFKDTVDASLGILEPLLEGLALGKAVKVADDLAEPLGDIVTKGKEIATDTKSKVIPSATEKAIKEIESIENAYVTTRKANDTGLTDVTNSRRRIAESGVLEGAVDNDGLLRTTVEGGAVDQYKAVTVSGVEDVVSKLLEREGKTVNIAQLEKALTLNTYRAGLEGSDLVTAVRGLAKEIEGLKLRADEFGNIPLSKIQDFKISTTNQINYLTDAKPTVTFRKAKASTYKEIIEELSDYPVKKVNAELAKYYKDIERLQRLDGKRVKGGRLGKYFSQISGNIIGGAGGSVAGGPGIAIGSLIGGELAGALQGQRMARTFGKGGNRLGPNEVLENAKKEALSKKKVDLKTPDRPVGVSPDIPHTRETRKLEREIRDNVKAQKKAIQAKDYTLVATLKQIYTLLVEKLKEQIKFIKENMDSEAGFANFGGGKSPDLKNNNFKGTKGLSKKQKETLGVVHNLTAEKLKFSDEIGGLTNPSVAVIKPDVNDFESFGDISLIADSDFLFSGKGKTFGADVYSPRFPQVDTYSTNYDQFKKTLKKYGITGFVDDESFYRVAKNSEEFEKAFENNLKLPPRERIEEFDLFIEQIAEEAQLKKRIFDGFTPSGKRKYLDVNAETISKSMNKKDVRAGESSFYGLPSIRSLVAPEFKSKSAIKKAESLIVSKEKFTEIKELYGKRFTGLLDNLLQYYKYEKNSFGAFDDVGRAMGEYLSGKRDVLNEVFDNLPEEVISELDNFGSLLAEMPTEYFETKFKRVVDLEEFNHAVIPEKTPKSVIDILNRKGISYSTYKAGEGNQAKALKEALVEKGLMFGLGGLVVYGANE